MQLDEPPSFWACDVAPGSTVTQVVPSGASLCLTGAGLAPGAEVTRSTLWADSAGSKAVMANLSSTSGHSYVRLGQPFSGQVTFSVVGAHTVHLTGFSKGKMPAVKSSKAARKGETVAGKAKAVSAEELMGINDADDDDDDDGGGGGEEEEEDEEAEGEGEEMDLEEVERLLKARGIAELREMCEEMEQPTQGSKAALIERILAAMQADEEKDEDEGEEEEDEEGEGEGDEEDEEDEEGEDEEGEEMDVEEVRKRLMGFDPSDLEQMLKEMELLQPSL